MGFQISGKIALVTGGASGIGLSAAKELLKNGLKAVTIADINEELGQQVVEEILEEFGPNKAIFVKTDVSQRDQFINAFDKTIEYFKGIDILVNNAGTINELDYERLIAINLTGTAIGTVLALENYVSKYKSGEEGLILNIASLAGIVPSELRPIYSASKHGVVALTRAYGAQDHYEEYKVKVVAICPGFTNTPMVKNPGVSRNPRIEARGIDPSAQWQNVEYVSKGLIRAAQQGMSGSVWVIQNSRDPYEPDLPTRNNLKQKLS